MKSRTVVAVLLALASTAFASEKKEYRVYESGKPLLPSYIVKERPDGSQAVYDVRKPREGYLVPRYIVRDGKVYDSAHPVLPLGKVDGGK